MLGETDLIPYAPSPPVGERVLVLAPHPDDESLGCGGAIRLLIEAGRHVTVVFLTSGDKADPADPSTGIVYGEPHLTEYARMREEEAKEALGVLGVRSCEFLRFPDRGLHDRREEVGARIVAEIGAFRPDVIYAPSPVELNPDHRATASLALALQASLHNGAAGVAGLSVVFYEVTVPLRPNVLVDVSGVFEVKTRAIGTYRSQLRLVNYLRIITAINTMRTVTLGGQGYAEAFWHLSFPWSSGRMSDWLGCRISALEEVWARNGSEE